MRLLEVLVVSTRLGLTSFGGPTAHMGYYHEEYVRRRNWLDEQTYADLVALCQFLPGPASSQVGIAIGIVRAGLLGGFVVWLGFTMPSDIALILFSYGIDAFGVVADAGWLHGLKVVAVVVIALAVWSMAKTMAPDKTRATIAIISAIAIMSWSTTGWAGGLFALGAIFLPSFLLVVGALPFWDRLRSKSGFRGALQGINTAVVGLLFAGLYNPVFTSPIDAPKDVALPLAAAGLALI